eukprot:3228254-Amphidinium_carterae.1
MQAQARSQVHSNPQREAAVLLYPGYIFLCAGLRPSQRLHEGSLVAGATLAPCNTIWGPQTLLIRAVIHSTTSHKQALRWQPQAFQMTEPTSPFSKVSYLSWMPTAPIKRAHEQMSTETCPKHLNFPLHRHSWTLHAAGTADAMAPLLTWCCQHHPCLN